MSTQFIETHESVWRDFFLVFFGAWNLSLPLESENALPKREKSGWWAAVQPAEILFLFPYVFKNGT